MDERRHDTRSNVFKKGSISFGGSTIDCMVRNLSATGALLDVETPLGIPKRFTLVVAADSFSGECRVVWVREKRLGVRFDPPARRPGDGIE